MRVDVHIERLVLTGVPVGRDEVVVLRRRLGAELGGLLAGAGDEHLASAGVTVPLLRAVMPAPPPSDAGAWGERIAGAVHQVVLP